MTTWKNGEALSEGVTVWDGDATLWDTGNVSLTYWDWTNASTSWVVVMGRPIGDRFKLDGAIDGQFD